MPAKGELTNIDSTVNLSWPWVRSGRGWGLLSSPGTVCHWRTGTGHSVASVE